MKSFIGGIMIIAGIALGLYVGVWLMFIGGIHDIYTFLLITFKTSTDPGIWMLAKGILKVLFAGFTGWLSALVLILPGFSYIK